jgi:hypothetical protein
MQQRSQVRDIALGEVTLQLVVAEGVRDHQHHHLGTVEGQAGSEGWVPAVDPEVGSDAGDDVEDAAARVVGQHALYLQHRTNLLVPPAVRREGH